MQTVLNVGVDVAKASVMVACAESSFAPQWVDNRRAALLVWLRGLPPGSRLGLEATGRYHQLLADLAHAQGLIVYVLTPKDTRHYARALGRRGKTDRVDAQMLARYVAKEYLELHPYVPPSPTEREIDHLLRRRARVVALKGALRASGQDLGECSAALQAALDSLQTLIIQLDEQLAARVRASPPHQQVQQRLQTIVGVGPLVSTCLANLFSRIAFGNADAVVAYSGFDPRPCDSGQKIGRRRLSKRGPSELRRLLYNAAMSAAKTTTWKPFYLHHRSHGWSSTAASVILARKLLRTAWALYKHNTIFVPPAVQIIPTAPQPA